MYEAVKPALDKMEDLVPQPKGNTSLSPYMRKKNGDPHPYSMGGLKSTLRIKIVRDRPYEIKGLVGSKKKIIGRYLGTRKPLWNAGNRAHFAETGPTSGKRFWKHKPFAKPAEVATANTVQIRLQSGLDEQLRKEFNTEQ